MTNYEVRFFNQFSQLLTEMKDLNENIKQLNNKLDKIISNDKTS